MYPDFMVLRSDLHGHELVAVKDSGSPDALRHEAALLEELDHHGIIRFVALTEDERGLRLLTRYAGRETLATWQPQRLEDLRRVFEDLATTVCHLHDHDVVHRAIRPSHVLIDAMRRPLLCSLSAARRVGAPNDGRADGENPRSGDGTGDGAAEQVADVAALGRTMLAVLERLDEHGTRSRRRREEHRLRERLGAVAAAAEAGRVRTAKALAGQLQALDSGVGHRPASVGDDNGADTDVATAGGPARGTADAGWPGGSSDPGGTGGIEDLDVGREVGGGACTEEMLRRLRTPSSRLPPGGRRRHRNGGRRTRHRPGSAPTGLRWMPQPGWLHRRPNRRILRTAAGLAAGCAVGTLMVLRLLEGDVDAPATIVADTVGSPGDARDLSGEEAGAPTPDTTSTPGRAVANPEAVTPVEPTGAASGGTSGAAETGGDATRSGSEALAGPPLGDSRCRAVAAGHRDTTGDGCAEEILLGEGFVSVDGVRYPVGDTGDQLAVGDWDCDGIATLALAQSNGRVYLFDSWPTEAPLTGELTAALPPPVLLQDVPSGACNRLVAHYGEDTWHLPLPAPDQ